MIATHVWTPGKRVELPTWDRDTEIRKIDRAPGYFATLSGRIIYGENFLLANHSRKSGPTVRIVVNGVRHTAHVATMVASAFFGDPPEKDQHTLCYRDGNKLHVWVSNLYWEGFEKENSIDR